MRSSASAARFPLVAAAAVVLAAAGTARAQRDGYTHLSYVGPEVSLVSRADEDTAAGPNMPVVPGDILVTGAASRAEAILADGNVVRLDGDSELRFESLDRTFESDDDRTVLALARGSAAVEVRDVSTREHALRFDTDDATVLSPARSVFRVDTGERGTEVYVLAGKVEVNGRGGRALVRAGEYAHVAGDAEIEVEAAGEPRDRFAAFVDERRGRSGDMPARDAAVDLAGPDSAAFDDSGSWTYVASAGATCWRPNVSTDWTPYSLGTWRRTPAGLTWVSYEAWGWRPYHYGKWARDARLGWYWIPGSVYTPAQALPRGGRVAVRPRTLTPPPGVPRREWRGESWRAGPESRARIAGAPARATQTRVDDGWRATSSLAPAPVDRRAVDRRDVHGDSGWRAPAPRLNERSSPALAPAPPPPAPAHEHAPAAPSHAPAASRRDG